MDTFHENLYNKNTFMISNDAYYYKNHRMLK